MKPQTFILWPDSNRDFVLTNLKAFLSGLPNNKPWKVEIGQYRKRRTNDANAYYWGVVIKCFTDALEGWDADDVHDYLLGEWSGWERVEGLGKTRLKPVRRSSKLTTVEFAELVDFAIRKASEHGIYVPSPDNRNVFADER